MRERTASSRRGRLEAAKKERRARRDGRSFQVTGSLRSSLDFSATFGSRTGSTLIEVSLGSPVDERPSEIERSDPHEGRSKVGSLKASQGGLMVSRSLAAPRFSFDDTDETNSPCRVESRPLFTGRYVR